MAKGKTDHHPSEAGDNPTFETLVQFIIDKGIGLKAPDKSGRFRWTYKHPSEGEPKGPGISRWAKGNIPTESRQAKIRELKERIIETEKFSEEWCKAIDRAYSAHWREVRFRQGKLQRKETSLTSLFAKSKRCGSNGLTMIGPLYLDFRIAPVLETVLHMDFVYDQTEEFGPTLGGSIRYMGDAFFRRLGRKIRLITAKPNLSPEAGPLSPLFNSMVDQLPWLGHDCILHLVDCPPPMSVVLENERSNAMTIFTHHARECHVPTEQIFAALRAPHTGAVVLTGRGNGGVNAALPRLKSEIGETSPIFLDLGKFNLTTSVATKMHLTRAMSLGLADVTFTSMREFARNCRLEVAENQKFKPAHRLAVIKRGVDSSWVGCVVIRDFNYETQLIELRVVLDGAVYDLSSELTPPKKFLHGFHRAEREFDAHVIFEILSNSHKDGDIKQHFFSILIKAASEVFGCT